MAASGSLHSTLNGWKPLHSQSPCAAHWQHARHLKISRQQPRPSTPASPWSGSRPHFSCHAKKRQQQLAEEDGMRETEAAAGASVQDDLAAELAEAEEAASASCIFSSILLGSRIFSSWHMQCNQCILDVSWAWTCSGICKTSYAMALVLMIWSIIDLHCPRSQFQVWATAQSTLAGSFKPMFARIIC